MKIWRIFLIFSLLSILGLVIFIITQLKTDYSPDDSSAASSTSTKDIRKVLILGNSITTHPPSAALGWNGNWGMAASSQSSDYVHLVFADIKIGYPNAQLKYANISTFEREFWKYDLNTLSAYKNYNADLIIIKIGENVTDSNAQTYNFYKYYTNLVKYLKATSGAKVLLVGSFWYQPNIDAITTKVATDNKYEYISTYFSSTPKTKATQYKDQGVSQHPNDYGMSLIADAITKKVKSMISTEYTFSPWINSDCRAITAPAPKWYQSITGTCGANTSSGHPSMWLLSSTNENSQFTGGTLSDLKPDGKLWKYEFHKKPDGSYQVGWVLDKINFTHKYDNKYTFVGFTDSYDLNSHLTRPSLGSDLYVDLNLGVFADEQKKVSTVGDAKTRIMIGIVASSPTNTYYAEINLRKSSNFDLCKTTTVVGSNVKLPCDTTGLYDRRLQFSDPSTGKNVDIIYVNRDYLNKALGLKVNSYSVDKKMHSIQIPVTKLFKTLPWSSTPASWSNIKIQGVYIGTEIWGRGRTWVEFDNYRLYSK